MAKIAAGPITEASFKDMAFDTGGSLHRQGDGSEEWLHEATERLGALDQDEVQVIRHDDECQQPGVRASRLAGEPSDYEIA